MRLLYRSPTFWVDQLGEEQVIGTGDGGSSQPAMGCGHYVVQSSDTVAVHDVATPDVIRNDVHRYGIQVVFPAEEVPDMSPAPRATRAAKYMTAMGLWRPRTGPVIPGQCLPCPATLV